MLDLGTKLETAEEADASYKQIHATAAKGPDGSLGVFVARYSDGDNISTTHTVVLSVPGRDLGKARIHLTDACRIYAEIPGECAPDGSIVLRMQPNSFAFVEVP